MFDLRRRFSSTAAHRVDKGVFGPQALSVPSRTMTGVTGSQTIHSLSASLRESIRELLAGQNTHDFSAPGDAGLCGPGSVSWQVLADPAALIGGVRALLSQSLHPSTVQGVVDHSAYEADPLGRLHRTVAYVSVTTFGTTTDAQQLARRVAAVHTTVQGVREDGTPYSASDPRLLLWVHCCLVDSLLHCHQVFGRTPLDAQACDRFVAEQARIGALLGIDAPTSSTALQVALESFQGELGSTTATETAMAFLRTPPLPDSYMVPYKLLFNAAAATLPDAWRRTLDVRSLNPALDRTIGAVLIAALRTVLGESPNLLDAKRRALGA